MYRQFAPIGSFGNRNILCLYAQDSFIHTRYYSMMSDYPTSLCPTFFLNLDTYTVLLMYLRTDCPLNVCLFYCVAKAQALAASIFFPGNFDTESNVRHFSKFIQRTFSLIILCVVCSKNHQQKSYLSRKLENHFKNRTAAVLFLCWVLLFFLVFLEESIWRSILYQTFSSVLF